MRLWLLLVVAGFSAGSASAAGPAVRRLQTASVEPRHFDRSFDLHIIRQEATDMSRIQRSGMIAQTGVAPNMELGLALSPVRKNRVSSLEPKSDVRVKQSRKLGLSFNWRF